MKKLLFFATFFAFVLALIFFSKKPELLETTLLTPAKSLPSVMLADTNGDFSSEKFKGQWSVLFFGYADCPEICPRTLAVMRQVAFDVPNLHFYFITADPQHDTAERIAQLLAPVNANFVGLGGETGEIYRLARALGVYIGARPAEEGEHMGHSPSLFIIDPQGDFAGLISNPVHSGNIAHDLNILFG